MDLEEAFQILSDYKKTQKEVKKKQLALEPMEAQKQKQQEEEEGDGENGEQEKECLHQDQVLHEGSYVYRIWPDLDVRFPTGSELGRSLCGTSHLFSNRPSLSRRQASDSFNGKSWYFRSASSDTGEIAFHEERKPIQRTQLCYCLNLATSTSDESLTKFVQHRAKSTTKRDVPVHNTKIFSATDGHETNFARITINSADSPLLLSRTFWPRALHCRRWHFKEQQQQQQQDKKQHPEGGCEQQQQTAGTLDDAERAAALLRSAYNHTPGSARDDDLDLSLSPDSNWGDDCDPLLGAREEGATPVQGGKRSNDHLSPPETTGAKRADTNRGQPPSDS